MAYDDNKVNNSVLDDMKERFSHLDQKQQVGAIAVCGLLFLVMLSRLFGGNAPEQQSQAQKLVEQPQKQEVREVVLSQDAEKELFSAGGADESVLRRNFVSETVGRFDTLEGRIDQKMKRLEKVVNKISEHESSRDVELGQLVRSINETKQSLQQTIARQQEENSRLLEDLKQQRLRDEKTAGTEAQQQDFLATKPIRIRKQGISQTPLSLGGNVGTQGTPLVEGLTGGLVGGEGGGTIEKKLNDESERKPFIPPLGFIKGTMLNGVDALTGGSPTPSLVRLEGVYKTAMNSTVILNGCFMLVEFQGDISTERAKGKPARMTCVYPDQGAVTYSVSGYVVDSEDGLEGVPGLFFEGHAGRMALSIAAEFAAGISEIVENNQSTNTTNADGVSTSTITGSEAKASMYGSASDSMSSLEDYLADRASRVVPFVRIDALREVNIVLLSGTQLRSQGDAWSQLFKAE